MEGAERKQQQVRADAAGGAPAVAPANGSHPLLTLQRSAGNQAVTALLRSAEGTDPLGGATVPGELEAAIASSSGQPLESGTRASMESAFGADFS